MLEDDGDDHLPVVTSPGTNGPAEKLFDVSQVLSWLARDRRDVQEQLAWTRDIPSLMEELGRMLN